MAANVTESYGLEPLTHACDHTDLEELGQEGQAVYYRCRSCGAVLVAQGNRVWLIHEPRP